MIDSSRSRWMGIDSWAGQPLYSLAPPIEEGMALCAVMEGGRQAATVLAAPGANDIFIGIAYSSYTRPTTLVAVENYTVPVGGGAITIANTPNNGAAGAGLYVFNNTTNTAATYNATAGTGVYQVSGANNQTLTFNAAQAGNSISVRYAFSPTLAEIYADVGDGTYFGGVQPSDITGTIGNIRKGIVYVSNFDPAADYSVVNAVIKVQPNGNFGVGGAGPTVNGYIYEQPSADLPFLGIYLR